VIEVTGDDPEAANVLRLADGSVLVSDRHDETATVIEQHGYRVVRVDVSEFGRADGGLTCLSIRVR
jgi:dimethylargininase